MSITNKSPEIKYYLPHHPVIKETRSTTKVRVVFDGSAKTSNNISLNDILMVGPTIQDDLFSIIIRFRTHQYVITADIEKMYRQINIHPDDRDLQRILWRENPTEPVKIYTLNTVTYGTSSAPFLAIRALKQLAIDEGHAYPDAARVLCTSFYVDDCLTGASSIQEAKSLKEELSALLAKGKFNLRKWRSNDNQILNNSINRDNTDFTLSFDNNETVKTLGLYWNPNNDTFQYTISNKQSMNITKRCILSLIAQIFDPLGLLGPIITTAKLIMQELWQLKLDWDESLPLNLHTTWVRYYNDLSIPNKLKIPRKIIAEATVTSIEIHGFCDASESAFGACIYTKTMKNDGTSYTSLICSKSRVAPLKHTTIPRLELCAALLLSQLSNKVRKAMSIDINHVYHWTDSTIVLAWIETSPHLLKQFVANRIAEIQELSQEVCWKHVPSEHNPADSLSRGLHPSQLTNHNIWWNGPVWLQKEITSWPNLNTWRKYTSEELEKKKTVNLLTIKQDYSSLETFSSFNKLKRVIGWCFRFTHNSTSKMSKQIGPLTIDELTYSETTILKMLQQQCFRSEIHELQKNNQVDKTNKLLNLHPFLDEVGLIRVGGRLKNAIVTYNQRHPIILPAKHYLTETIIREEHEIRFHCGQHSLLAFIRLKFWPLSAKNTIRKITQNCITCFRCNPKPAEHLMGNLPTARLKPGIRPFVTCGVDYCDPFNIIESKGRGRKKQLKCYLAIFICFITKAIHIEPITDLTSEAFLAALRRFTARRGLCSELYSDNGTNFTKTNRDLRDLYRMLIEQEGVITTQLTKQNINWHFIPPRSPHFGGLWESAVKICKYHLKRVFNSNLTYEEFYTLVTQIEAILNSRPLLPMSSDPNDLTILTPSHFLIGDSLLAPVEVDVSEIKDNLLSRWQHLQKIRQHFWKRWSTEYVHHLQQWIHETNNLTIGSLVLLIDENLPPQRWNIGRIIQLHPEEDLVTRVVSVKTSSGVFKRAIRKICVLPINKSVSAQNSG